MADSHRDALLDAARTLLRTKGLRATTSRDLVAESGTNLASIGYHFGGKDALMATALSEVFQDWTERPVAAAGTVSSGSGPTPGDALAAAIRTMLAGLTQQRPEILAFLESVVVAGREEPTDPGAPGGSGGSGGAHGVAPSLATLSTRALDAVAASITEASPGLHPEAAAAAAAVVVALHDGLALLSTILPERVPDADVVLGVIIAFGQVLAESFDLTPDQVTALTTTDTDPADG